MSEPRIAPLADDQLEGNADYLMQPLLEAGTDWNIFRVLANHPHLARRWMVFANHVLYKSTIPARERELAILRVGWLCQAEYEWAQHKIMGRDAGLTDADIERIKAGPEAEGWPPLDRLVLLATDDLHHHQCIGDEAWGGLQERWSQQQLMDLVFTVGEYTLVAMALRTFEVPLDDFLEGF